MRKSLCLFLFLLALFPVCGASLFKPSDTVFQGVVVEKWELGKWQVEDDWTQLEGYSRFKVLIESPSQLAGRTVTIFYNKWDVPREWIPRRKGVRCGFTVSAGVAEMKDILWPMIHQFWLGSLPAAPRPLPPGKPAFSM